MATLRDLFFSIHFSCQIHQCADACRCSMPCCRGGLETEYAYEDLACRSVVSPHWHCGHILQSFAMPSLVFSCFSIEVVRSEGLSLKLSKVIPEMSFASAQPGSRQRGPNTFCARHAWKLKKTRVYLCRHCTSLIFIALHFGRPPLFLGGWTKIRAALEDIHRKPKKCLSKHSKSLQPQSDKVRFGGLKYIRVKTMLRPSFRFSSVGSPSGSSPSKSAFQAGFATSSSW